MAIARLPRFVAASLLGFGLLLSTVTSGDGPPPTAENAAEQPTAGNEDPLVEFLDQYSSTYRFRLGLPSSITPLEGGSGILYLRSGARSFVNNLYHFAPETGQERLLLTAEQILGGGEEELSVEEKARRERMRIAAGGITSFELSDDGRHILAPLGGRLFWVDRASGKSRELPVRAGFPLDPQLSPDGTRVAYVADGDLYTLELDKGEERRLTQRESPAITHGLAEFVAQEEMSRFHGFWWSPDGKRIAYQRNDETEVETFRIADPSDPGKAPQEWRYPRPGKANAEVTLGILPAEGGATVWIDWDQEKYPYLATLRWPDDAPMTLLVQNRQQTEEALLAVDTQSGKTRSLLVEQDPAWINLDQDMPHWLPGGESFFWTSERSGNWRLELRRADGGLERTLTPPDLIYQGFVHFDAAASEVYLQASTDPTEMHLYRLPLKAEAGAPLRLTREPGQHDAFFSPEGGLRVYSLATANGPKRFEVRDGEERAIGQIPSRQEAPIFSPDPEFLRLEAGEGFRSTFHAVVHKPGDFDPAKSYPVLVRVYGGPHAQMVQKNRDRYLLDQWMANHGLLVVSFDGRGTPNRGRAWERSIKHNFIDAPLEDQVQALSALAGRIPQMDLQRVGIYGWSFGGYFSAMGVMRRPDVYHVGVAGAPVADWLDYDTHYTERYAGLPQEHPEAYERSSVLTYAKDLERPLLIIHGTADDNVYFTHSLKMSKALFEAGRDHQFLPLASQTHGVRDPEVSRLMNLRIIDFLLGHLGSPKAR